MTDDDRLRSHPNERLSGAVNHIDLAEEAARLRAEPHAGKNGHRQVALMKRGALTMLLYAFETAGQLPEHQTDGEVVIQVLSGRLEVMTNGQAVVMPKGSLLSLAPNQPHAVRALEVSDMLLTVCRSATPAA